MVVQYFFISLLALMCGKAHLSGCPHMQSAYEAGKQVFQQSRDSDKFLHDSGFIVKVGEPASNNRPFAPLSEGLANLYGKSTTLLLALQYYNEIYFTGDINNTQTASLRRKTIDNQTECIALEDRCFANTSISCPENVTCVACDTSGRYRSYSRLDGICKNKLQPLWGAQSTAFTRLLPAAYDDGIHVPRKSVTGQLLPSARSVSNKALQRNTFVTLPQKLANYMSFIYGQYIAHDSGLFEFYQLYEGGTKYRCCSIDYRRTLPEKYRQYGCFPMEVPDDDPFYKNYNLRCLNFVRAQTSFSTDCRLKAAQQTNTVSHSMDLSNIYGSNEGSAAQLRAFSNGSMLTNKYGLLGEKPNCTGSLACYLSPEGRGKTFTTLVVLEAISLRFHNSLAQQFAAANADWDDEKIWQESRRINIVVHQSILYNEWLPLYIGRDVTSRRQLICPDPRKHCGQFDATVNVGSLNDFSHGAFKTFHQNIPSFVNFYDAGYRLLESRYMTDMVIGPKILETKFMEILRGLMIDPIAFDKFSNDLRNHLFNSFNKLGLGYDLLSGDIQRSRDNGLQPYYRYVNALIPGKSVTQWSDLIGLISIQNIFNLMNTYESVFDVDLLVGMLLEIRNGVYVGPVAVAIIEEQFYRYKYGDSFFFSFANGTNPLTEDQLTAVTGYSFTHLICQFTDLDQFGPNGFEQPSDSNTPRRCYDYDKFNLAPWLNKNNNIG